VEFRWIGWNIAHIARHNAKPPEAEYVVDHPGPGYPARPGDDKSLVRGQTADGRYLQVVYLIDEDGTIFVIHARELTKNEKRRLKRRKSK
jgi:uncharacterized DUF497 family protein